MSVPVPPFLVRPRVFLRNPTPILALCDPPFLLFPCFTGRSTSLLNYLLDLTHTHFTNKEKPAERKKNSLSNEAAQTWETRDGSFMCNVPLLYHVLRHRSTSPLLVTMPGSLTKPFFSKSSSSSSLLSFASQISIPLLFPFTLFLFLLYHFDNEDKGGMQFNLAPESRSADIRFFFFSKLE